MRTRILEADIVSASEVDYDDDEEVGRTGLMYEKIRSLAPTEVKAKADTTSKCAFNSNDDPPDEGRQEHLPHRL
jgi:hypothetical protein